MSTINNQKLSELRLHPLAATMQEVLQHVRPKSLAALALLAGLSAGPAPAATISVVDGWARDPAVTRSSPDAPRAIRQGRR